MASTTASTAEVQNAAATPKEVLRLVSNGGRFYTAWLGFIQQLLHGQSLVDAFERLYSTPLTWHGLTLFSIFYMACCSLALLKTCDFFITFDTPRLSDAFWKPRIQPLTLLFD